MGNLTSLSELISSGKSGSFFYYSPDGRFTIKTIKEKEFLVFKNMLKNYYSHMMNYYHTMIC